MAVRRGRFGVLAAAVVTVMVGLAVPSQAAVSGAPELTSRQEAARVDRVPTPRLAWRRCHADAECADVRLPLDYDSPSGASTTVALLRVRARHERDRIGSLFVNPGGPSGSATQFALGAASYLSPELLDRFDIVGMDPRGVGSSERVRCFASAAEQAGALRRLTGPGFPFRPAQEADAVSAAGQLGRACSTTGQPLAASMSTAEVARDMDVVRRAVGDRQLSYLGVSYGSYLGQVYANMFPDRVRALSIDGVLDPVAWAGTPDTKGVPSTERLRSGEGAYRALHEILVRCDAAGPRRCPFATGDPVAGFELIARRLKDKPLEYVDPRFGPIRITYPDLVDGVLGLLYSPDGSRYIAAELAALRELTDPRSAVDPGRSAAATSAMSSLAQLLDQQRRRPARFAPAQASQRPGPYDFSNDAFLSVLCTDGLNPADAARWTSAADRAERRAPYFGRSWTWQSAPCAMGTWTGRDEDSYRGPFTRRTSSTVLVVGNYWDPATNYDGAVTASRLLPNSRLLSSDSWGHTAYRTSACVTGAVDAYLLRKQLPAVGTTCTGDVQPFA